MRNIYKISLFLILSLTLFSRANAQVSSCDSIVPVFYLDLTGHPDSTWISPLVYRDGLCCGDNGTRCLRFVITLDSSALGIAFNIASGALPSGSMYYKIDCGPEIAVGSPICLNGPGPHELTFCKPGNNENSYSIVSVPNPSVNSVIVSENCSQSINVSGIDSTTLTINSISPGTPGQYNSYLSCVTGCSEIFVNYQTGGPSYIDFEVCGTATLAECADDSIYCDTIRAFFVNNLTAIASPDSVNLCAGSGTTVLHGAYSGGAAPYSYFWTDGINGTGNIIGYDTILTVSASGDYSFIVRDSRFPGCSEAYDNVPVRYHPLPVITLAPTNIKCFGELTGAINLSIAGGVAPFGYSWSNGATIEDLTGLSAGTYSVTVTDALGCIGTASIILSQPLAPLSAIISSSINVGCFGQATGAADMTVSGGTTPYTYIWSNGAITQDLSNVIAGTYQVTATDANSCTTTTSVIISQPLAPLSAVISSSVNVGCFGGATGAADLIVSGGTAPYTYLWSNGAITQDLSNIIAGTYLVTVTDANSCTTTTSVAISQPLAPLSAVISGSINVGCFGQATGAADLTVSGGTAPYSYIWTNGAITQDLNNIIAGNYQVTVTDANSCTTTISVIISQPLAPVSAVISSSVNVGCFGEATGAADLTVSGGTAPYTYLWSNGAITQDLSNAIAGTYQVTATDANSCTTSTSVIIAQPLTPLSAVISSSVNVGCFGQATGVADLTVSGGTAPYSYIWSNGAITQDLSNIIAGTYQVTATDANSCTATISLIISQPLAPLSAVISGNVNVGCFGQATGAADLTVSGGTAPYSYIWSNGAITQDLSNIIAGTYQVTATDANSCTTTTSVVIVQPLTPLSAVISASVNVGCFGEATGAADLTVSGGTAPYTYLWSNGTITQDLSNIIAGTYLVTVTDANSCTATTSVIISQPLAPISAVISSSVNVGCFGEATGATDLTVSGGTAPYTYLWSNGTITQDLSNVIAGTYLVTVTDANGCTTSVSAIISQPAQPLSATISAIVNVLCFGNATGSADLTANGGTPPYHYLWSDGDTNEDLNNHIAGNYIVTVTDANNCTAIASVTISQPNAPLSIIISSSVNVACFGNSTGSANLTVTGGTAPYTYLWSNSTTSEDIINIPAGIYSVTVTDANGCSATTSVLIIQPAFPLSATVSGSVNVGCYGEATGSADLTISGGTAPYTYIWSNGAITQDLSNVIAGTYQVTITDANGCFTTASIIITEPSAPLSASISSNVNVLCYGNSTGSIDLSVTGGTIVYTYLWSNGATIEDISNLAAGSYTVTVTDANSCTVSTTLIISQPAVVLSATVTSSVNVLCYGNTTGAVDITVTGGTSPYSYLWSNGTVSEDLSNIPAGTYSVTVTDANGCSSTTSVLISQPSTPLSIALTESPATCGLNNGSAGATVIGGTPNYSYNWSPYSGGQVTPTIHQLNNGNYSVTVTDANGCTISSSISVSRIAPPQIEITSVTQETCSNSNGSISVSVINGTSPFVYQWSYNPEINTNTIFHVSQGQYTVIVTDHYGCTDTEVITITNHIAQIVQLDSVSPAHCNHADGCAFVTVEGGSGSYQFHWNSMPQNTSSSACGLSPGSYAVTVSDGVCDVTRNFIISNSSGPSADLTVNRRYALISDASFIFTNLSHDYTSCIWNFGDNTTSTLNNPTHVYSEPGTYQVILTIIDEYGCTSAANIEVIVSTELILWISNSFTPNGDGINDEYGPVATGFSEKGYEFRIFDRWGKEVFYSNDYYHRWDGKIKGETITTSFVFSWIILIYDLNGKQYKFKGSVSALGGE